MRSQDAEQSIPDRPMKLKRDALQLVRLSSRLPASRTAGSLGRGAI